MAGAIRSLRVAKIIDQIGKSDSARASPALTDWISAQRFEDRRRRNRHAWIDQHQMSRWQPNRLAFLADAADDARRFRKGTWARRRQVSDIGKFSLTDHGQRSAAG
jgi:hypothetical protein